MTDNTSDALGAARSAATGVVWAGFKTRTLQLGGTLCEFGASIAHGKAIRVSSRARHSFIAAVLCSLFLIDVGYIWLQIGRIAAHKDQLGAPPSI